MTSARGSEGQGLVCQDMARGVLRLEASAMSGAYAIDLARERGKPRDLSRIFEERKLDR